MNLNTFRQNITKPAVKLRYKFLYDSVDYTDLVLDLPTITRNINLAAGKATIVLNNSGGWWNFLHQTNDALGGPAEIQIYINGDEANSLTIFKGKVQRPKYQGAKVALIMRDFTGDFLNIKVGSNRQPANWYFGGNRTPAQLVWHLLTTEGELDSTSDPSNTDIDYTSFAAWRDQHSTPEGYEFEAKPTGHSIGTILMKTCQLSHSYIFVTNDGKIGFAPPFDPGYSYDESNSSMRDLEMNEDKIINSVEARYARNVNSGEWVHVTAVATEADSIARFGTFPKTIEDRVVWHEVQTGAEADRDTTLTDYAYGLRFVTVKAGPPAIMENLCNQITVTDTLKEMTGITPIIEDITYDLDRWEVSMKARWPW